MYPSIKASSDAEVAELLRRHGVSPTAQRVLITRTLLSRIAHFSAEDVFRLVNTGVGHNVSKATVYNTLGLLASKGVVREVIADPNRIFYDSNTAPHYHFYEEATGELTDIDAQHIQVSGLPPLPEGTRLQGIDVIVRLQRKRK